MTKIIKSPWRGDCYNWRSGEIGKTLTVGIQKNQSGSLPNQWLSRKNRHKNSNKMSFLRSMSIQGSSINNRPVFKKINWGHLDAFISSQPFTKRTKNVEKIYFRILPSEHSPMPKMSGNRLFGFEHSNYNFWEVCYTMSTKVSLEAAFFCQFLISISENLKYSKLGNY